MLFPLLSFSLLWYHTCSEPAILPSVSVVVQADSILNPSLNPYWNGCFSDSGYGHQPRGFTANILYGSSFEDGKFKVPAWVSNQSANADATFGWDDSVAWSSRPSKYINIGSSASGVRASLSNRGMAGAGFQFLANHSYEFEVWLFSGHYQTPLVTAYVELRDFNKDITLASKNFSVLSSGASWCSTWNRYTFELTPSMDTTCQGIAPNSDPRMDCSTSSAIHPCIECSGEFVIGITTPNSRVNLGFISLMPGTWGRLKGPNGYLPVLSSMTSLIQQMGVPYIRFGGTVAQSYRWKDWRGPVWNRPSQQLTWGSSLLSGWGLFEFLNMVEALGIEPTITLAYDTNFPQDWADLVEYCWGNSNTTTWGKMRALDGHPNIYNVTYFELGNEQYNPNFVDQIAAMEDAAKRLGTPPLKYMFPAFNASGSTLPPNATDAQRIINLGIPPERILADFHLPGLDQVKDFFANPPIPGFDQTAINGEINSGRNNVSEALWEATDLINWFTYDPAVMNRLHGRTVSMCTGAGAPSYGNFDQSLISFFPNMSFLQPTGWIHNMINQTWADILVVSKITSGASIPFSAHLTRDKSKLILRVVNNAGDTQPLTITIQGISLVGSTFQLLSLGSNMSNAVNTPANPANVVPQSRSVPFTSGSSVEINLPAYTFAVLSFDVKGFN